MEKIEVLVHNHPLIHFTRFSFARCPGCSVSRTYYFYGGYRCNELGCGLTFHKECAESLPELNHSFHPDHSLKLIIEHSICSLCSARFMVGYCCSICDFKLDLGCAKRPAPLVILENSDVHEHPLELFEDTKSDGLVLMENCKACDNDFFRSRYYYRCCGCKFFIHMECVKFFPEVYHTSHPRHPLKFLSSEAPDYADKECLLCGMEFNGRLHHCDICNFSICEGCMRNPPPLCVVTSTTHEHQLHLVPRRISFTCNACGTQGDRSPYFCLQCNFMIHWDCIDLPRVININRHDHRISYTLHLGHFGHGEWKCGVCRKIVDGFYGGYSCSRCFNYVVHSRCATRPDVWDMIELEGVPEEEEVPPFEVIDENTIKHFSHAHNLRVKKDGMILHESKRCDACVSQIFSESFYSCEQCDFILHEKCANLTRKKRHVSHNQLFTLGYDEESHKCFLCAKYFTGFRYQSTQRALDVQCGSIFEPFVHESHPHPLYFSIDKRKGCSECGKIGELSCDECDDFYLDFKCASLPQKVMSHRYDDHPLFLSYGETNVDSEYWCEACETKVNPKKWFYTCGECGVILHISCVIGDFSYIMPGSIIPWDAEVVSNNSICRPVCFVCNSRCKLPSIVKASKAGIVVYICSFKCHSKFYKRKLQ